jgi:hypothetical protein
LKSKPNLGKEFQIMWEGLTKKMGQKNKKNKKYKRDQQTLHMLGIQKRNRSKHPSWACAGRDANGILTVQHIRG